MICIVGCGSTILLPLPIFGLQDNDEIFERHGFLFEIDLHVTGMPNVVRVLIRIREREYFKQPPYKGNPQLVIKWIQCVHLYLSRLGIQADFCASKGGSVEYGAKSRRGDFTHHPSETDVR